MRVSLFAFFLFSGFLFSSFVLMPAWTGPLWAGEVEVLDAEHLRLDGSVYRLAGIDAPEAGQLCRLESKDYPCGVIAVGGLMDLTAGAEIVCRPWKGATPSPALPRPFKEAVVARCYASGYELSEGMVYTGWALAERETGQRFLDLEADARAKQRGLWRGAFVMPWDWRAGERLSPKPGAD